MRNPPGPRGWPKIGCLAAMRRNPMEFFTRVALRYGGIARFPLGKNYFYLVTEPDLIYELLITNRARYMKNVRYRELQLVLGQGMLLSEGDYWKRQRLIAQPSFKTASVESQHAWMNQMIGEFFDQWKDTAARQEAIDVEPEFFRLAQMIALRQLFGPSYTQILEPFLQAVAGIKKFWPTPPKGLLGIFRKPPPEQRENFDRVVSELDAVVYPFIRTQRESGFDGEGMLATFAGSTDLEGKPWSDEELRDQVLTMFFAGHETSATSMCWIHYFLSLNPAMRDRLHQEIDSTIASRVPLPEDLGGLNYTGQVINETLRIYSPIHALSRVALEDDTIGGYHIPKDATIIVSLYATHRLPKYWPDAERFDPERFSPEQSTGRSRFSFIPFAAGHRNCVGSMMAMIELKFMVAQLAQRYVLDLVPGQRIETAASTTMNPKYGMKMVIRNR